jgi:hypothetical protein
LNKLHRSIRVLRRGRGIDWSLLIYDRRGSLVSVDSLLIHSRRRMNTGHRRRSRPDQFGRRSSIRIHRGWISLPLL